MNIISYATTPLAGVPAILARCIASETSHRGRCIWAKSSYGNGVAFAGDIEWSKSPAEAEEELNGADVVIVHNGKVASQHRRIIDGKPVITMAHNCGWNVDCRYVDKGLPGVVVGQYQASLPEFQGWNVVPNPIPLWEPEYQPAEKPMKIAIAFTPSGKPERFPSTDLLHWRSKGYTTTMCVLDRLAQSYPLQLEVIRNAQVSNIESLTMKRRAHIVIDECVTGSYHRNSLEGLAVGCVVVNGMHLRVGVIDAFRTCAEIGDADIPFVYADVRSLERVLVSLIEKGAAVLCSMGRCNHEWMKSHWDFSKQWSRFWLPIVESAFDMLTSQKPSTKTFKSSHIGNSKRPGQAQSNFRVISYHTDLDGSAYYLNCAARMVCTLERLGIDHRVEAIASQGSYMANCRYKPMFIQTMLCRRRRPVLWVDVDSEIHRDLREFQELPAEVDVALVSPNGTLAGAKASPIYFNHTVPAMHLLSQWVARIADHEQYSLANFDHEALLEVIDELSTSVNWRLFDDRYCAKPLSGAGRPIITMGIAQNASKRQFLAKLHLQQSQYREFRNHSRIPKLLGFGFPFDVHASSCGKRKPKHFVWTSDEHDLYINAEVYMDKAIPTGITTGTGSGRAKVAWFVESRAIRPDIYEFAIERSGKIEQNYDAFFTCDRYLAEYLKNGILISSGSNLPWAQQIDPNSVRKLNLCSMFCSSKQSTEGHRLRHKVAATLGKKTDLFGGALGSERLGSGTFPDKSGALIDYMFHIVIENASYDNYYTEKLTDCFVTCAIPVYWGWPSVAEYFNADGIVGLDERFDLEQLTEELYLSKWDAVVDNYNRACDLLSADDELFLHLAGAV